MDSTGFTDGKAFVMDWMCVSGSPLPVVDLHASGDVSNSPDYCHSHGGDKYHQFLDDAMLWGQYSMSCTNIMNPTSTYEVGPCNECMPEPFVLPSWASTTTCDTDNSKLSQSPSIIASDYFEPSLLPDANHVPARGHIMEQNHSIPQDSTTPFSASCVPRDSQRRKQRGKTGQELRCWDHGCNGRLFTTSSNLARHRREHSLARPSYNCPLCGAYFSRTTARNTHVKNRSCTRIRRYSNGRERASGSKSQTNRSTVEGLPVKEESDGRMPEGHKWPTRIC